MSGPISLLSPTLARLDAKSAEREAKSTMEATFLKSLLEAGGGLSMGKTPGSSITEGLVLETLASVMAKDGALLGLDGKTTGIGGREVTSRGAIAALGADRQNSHGPSANPLTAMHNSLTHESSDMSGPRDHGHRHDPVHDLVAHSSARISSGFGMRRDPLSGAARAHAGVDVAAPLGARVDAAIAGTVTHAGPAGSYGNLVEITHADGQTTRYAHLHQVDVTVGSAIAAGQKLGEVGSTGRSTGAHLHFEVRDSKGNPTDPTSALRALSERSDKRDGAEYRAFHVGRRP